MKKLIFKLAVSLACFATVIGAFAGCTPTDEDETLKIVCTIFPQYDWVRVITESDEDISLTVLQTKATDLHNYTPTTSDMRTIYKCDVFIYVGGESDQWADAVLSSNNANKDMVVINLLEALGDRALIEEEVPGAEEEDHDHDHDQEEEELDEHVWLSLKNAQVLCTAISNRLSEIRPESKQLYQNNLQTYLTELEALDSEFETMVKNAPNDTVLFADRFPFRYLVEDYGLNYYAAFSGCSAETEVTPATLSNLIKAVNENKLTYVIVLELCDKKIADSVIAGADGEQTIVEMNSIQSVTIEEINAGTTYLSLMRTNLEALETALS